MLPTGGLVDVVGAGGRHWLALLSWRLANSGKRTTAVGWPAGASEEGDDGEGGCYRRKGRESGDVRSLEGCTLQIAAAHDDESKR